MVQEAERIDISNMPDLVRLAEEVARTRKPRLLTRGGEEVAMLSPARSKKRKKEGMTQAQREVVLASVGGWVGLVDPEQLKRDLNTRSQRRRQRKTVTNADIDAALAASWVGLIDLEKLQHELDDARGDDRPPLKL
jgi:hypothetical protein